MFDRDWIAANGYAVLQVNYRGSHGRGQDFQSAIFGDWGNKEVMDLLAGVEQDWAMKKGAVWWLRWRQRDGEPEVTLHAVQGPDAL